MKTRGLAIVLGTVLCASLAGCSHGQGDKRQGCDHVVSSVGKVQELLQKYAGSDPNTLGEKLPAIGNDIVKLVGDLGKIDMSPQLRAKTDDAIKTWGDLGASIASGSAPTPDATINAAGKAVDIVAFCSGIG